MRFPPPHSTLWRIPDQIYCKDSIKYTCKIDDDDDADDDDADDYFWARSLNTFWGGNNA